MRLIVNTLRFIIFLYLAILLVVSVIFFANRKIYHKLFTEFYGYSYTIVDNDYLVPEMKKGTFVILKQTDEVNVGDYVYYHGEEDYEFKKITSADEEKLHTNYVNYDEDSEIERTQVLASAYYYSPNLTVVYTIFTHPITIIVLIIFLILSPNLVYKRYDN